MGVRVLLSLVGAAIVLLASPARAQNSRVASKDAPSEDLTAELASPYRVLIGVERFLLVGPFVQSGEPGGGGMSFGAVGFAASTDDAYPKPFLPHAIPRLTVDVLLEEHLTVGAFAGLGRAYGATPNDGSSYTEQETPVSDAYVAGGRVGVLVPLADDSAAFWGKVGLAHAWGTQRTKGYYDGALDQLSALTAAQFEAALVFPVVSHFALNLCFGGDIALDGTLRSEPVDVDDVPATALELERTEVRRDSDAFFLWFGALGYI